MSSASRPGVLAATLMLAQRREFRIGLVHATVWGLLTGPLVSFLISGGLAEPRDWWAYVTERWTTFIWALPLIGGTWSVVLTVALSFFRWVVIPNIDLAWSSTRQFLTIAVWSMVSGFGSVFVIDGFLSGVFSISAVPGSSWLDVAAGVGLVGIVIGNLFFLSHQNQLRLQAEEQRREELERSGLESELMNLNMRIRPHFFFNALNTLSSLMDKDTEQAQAFLVDLADLFRASFAHGREHHTTTWRAERSLMETYLNLERGRFGDSLLWQLDVTAADDAPFPAFLLQPLVENAIHHGIAAMREPGTISLTGRFEADRWSLCLTNDVAQPVTVRFPEGHALAQIRDRLALMGGALEVGCDEKRFTVTMHWQQRRHDHDNAE